MNTATLDIKKRKVLFPKLRFQEFNEEWKESKLGDIGKIRMCKRVFSNETSEKGEIPFYKIGTFGKEADAYITNELYLNYKSRFSYPKIGDILMSASGTLGRTIIFDGKPAYFQDSNIVWIDNNEEFITNSFLYIIYQIVRYESEGGTIQRLYNSIISNTKFNNPTISEQQKIASFLSTVDEKIQQLSHKKKLLEQYKKGVMQQLFSGKLRFKDENGEDYLNWEEKKLGEVCKLNPKSSFLPSSFIYIDLESVVSGRLLKETRIQLSEAPSRAQRLLSSEDILFQMVRPYQKNNLFFNRNGEYVASTGYAQLRAKENSMFLYQLIHTTDFVNKVMDRCTGTSYPAINSSDLANIEIVMPSASEQQKIADFLSSIDTKIESTNKQITQTQTFKKGLLQQMFV